MEIFPSLISADLLNLEAQIKVLEPHCDGFHIDIMDNHFVPNLTWGPMFANAIARAATKKLCVHLMTEKSETLIERLKLPAGSFVIFHLESVGNHQKLIELIQQKGWTLGLAIRPQTPFERLYSLLDKIPQVLLMSVEPGFSGQPFLPESIERLKTLSGYRAERKLNFQISMDGGINKENIATLAENGCDRVAIAAGIFGTPEPIAALRHLREKIG